MVSSEMPEVLGMSDRIMVMHEGRISGEFDAKDADQEKNCSRVQLAKKRLTRKQHEYQYHEQTQ
ncbi:hypothetical protein QW180_25485 [Vibrio sinaloensis]|nr:hypothetical protein [Vibrio sinaloensis]